MLDMAQKQIFPAVSAYVKSLSETALAARQLTPTACTAETVLVTKLSALADSMYGHIEELKTVLHESETVDGAEAKSKFFCNTVIPVMRALRTDADELEASTAKSYWPYPTYSDMLFYV